MIKKKKLHLKRLYFHPVTSYLALIFLVLVIGKILSLFDFQTTYNVVSNGKFDQVTVIIQNLFSFDGIKYIISNASINFMSFIPLNMFLLATLGIAICDASGFLDALFKKIFSKLENKYITFIIIFIGVISTIINEIGYVILIPIAAIIYRSKNRNPIIGVVTAFCGVAFGTATSIFIGSTEVNLIPFTTNSARLIDSAYHVSLLSNLFIMIASTIIISIVGTIVIEKLIIPRLNKFREKKELDETKEIEVIDVLKVEQEILSTNHKENRGMKWAIIVGIIVVLIFIYSLIPNLPFSGLLLDMQEKTYLKQIFGENSYFQDGFTYMISLIFLLTGLAYGFGSRKFKNDKDVIKESSKSLEHVGGLILLIFLASQLISIVKKTNIPTIFTGILANSLSSLTFSGIPLLLIAILVIAISNILLPNITSKWMIFSPILVPVLMQANISPQFTQFAFRIADGLTNGITPLYPYFVIFIGYMNIYNKNYEKPITIVDGIRIIFPYFIIISITWLLLLLGWYIIGLPIGPGVFPTI